ncbi:MAG: hypothetical protein KAJ24_02260, partial [Candidatus Aenigmarchaeota archaeon]|nr:hypothetical protein [Candidatus Aenigmarchaeota archaeon]
MHTLYVRATDGAGNIGTVNRTIINVSSNSYASLNLTRKHFRISEQMSINATFTSLNGYITNASGCVVKAKDLFDSITTLGTVGLTTAGSNNAVCDGTVNLGTLTDKTYYQIFVEALDAINKTGVSVTKPVWVCEYKIVDQEYICKDICEFDTENPVVNFVMINDTILKPDSWISVEVNVSGEGNLTLKNVTSELGNLTWTSTYWTGIVQIDNDGYVNVTAIDKIGNIGKNETFNYTLDNIPPLIWNFTTNDTDYIVAPLASVQFNV